MAERDEIVKAAAVGVGVGLSAALLAETGKRIRYYAMKHEERVRTFEEELDTLVKAAAHEQRLDDFAFPIDFGHPILNYAVAKRLRQTSSDRQEDITNDLASYGVRSAVIKPMNDYPGLWVRQMDHGFNRGIRGKGFRFHIVGRTSMIDYEPEKYKPGPGVLA